MKIDNVHGLGTIDKYVKYKLDKYSAMPKNFESLFELMFDESDNVMAETSDGYRVKKITYGEYKQSILSVIPTVGDKLKDIPLGEPIGIYMTNSLDWLQIFWAVLASGYSPLIMNVRLSDEVLERVLSDHSVRCVISDGKIFSVRTVMKQEALTVSEAPAEKLEFGEENMR